jgi:hypothetical protein
VRLPGNQKRPGESRHDNQSHVTAELNDDGVGAAKYTRDWLIGERRRAGMREWRAT